MGDVSVGDFACQHVVVTGAASGIGRETALLLLARGARVTAVDLPGTALDDIAALGVDPRVCDVASADDRSRLLAEVGTCDRLVNAAGVISLLPVEEVDEAEWDRVLAVNLKGLFFLARDLGGRMVRGGAIVNVASVAAKYSATVETLVYGASKAAVVAVTRSLAYHFGGRGIRVNAVLPGIIDTPMQDRVLAEIARLRETTPDALHEARLKLVPLEHRQATPRECAEVIAFLLGDGASYMTGQAVAVDGGFMMY